MSSSRKTATGAVGSLDPESRRRVAWFALRCLALAAWAFMPWFGSAQTFQGCAVLLEFACSIGGIVSMLFAGLRGEPPWQGSLNGWDEVLAFVAVSRLAHFASQLQT